MNKILNATGYDLYEVTHNEWVLHVNNGDIYRGTFYKVARYAAAKLNFSLEEIELAAVEMTKIGHNGAHFGAFKRFIYTFNKDFKNVAKAAS